MQTIKAENLADAVMEGLKDYARLATDDLKAAVKEAGQSARKELRTTAPKKTGAYRKSWTYKVTGETANTINVTIHSKDRYRLTHLLENGHAKRGGGRVKAIPHISVAQDNAVEKMTKSIERSLGR